MNGGGYVRESVRGNGVNGDKRLDVKNFCAKRNDRVRVF